MLYVIYPNLLAKKAAGIYSFCGVFLVPVLILIFVYGRIAWVLARKADNRAITNKEKPVDSATDIRNRNYEMARRNILKTLTLVAVCFVICWAGNQVWLLIFHFDGELNWDSVGYQFLVLMICVNCVINPFIYLIQYNDYQKALKTLLCGKKKTQYLENKIRTTSTVFQNWNSIINLN